MKKTVLLTTLATFSLITGCATTSSINTQKNVSVAQMNVAPVTVDLSQKHDNPTFYNQTELSDYFTNCIKKELAKNGKYADEALPTLNLTIGYKRTYSGETFGFDKSINAPLLSYEYEITNQGQVLQQKKDSGLTVSAGMIKSYNYTGQTERADEHIYLDAICRDIVKEID